jgi:16S rRNA (cytosine967-C5)-methyltransferase
MVEVQLAASATVEHVLGGRSLDDELAASRRRHPQLAPGERAALQDLAYGTLRLLPRLAAVLDALLDKPLRDAKLRPLLLTALYQLAYTRAAQHAVVDHAVRCCSRLGLTSAKGLVNAVLRGFLRNRPALLARAQRLDEPRYCHPQWWIDKLSAQYPTHFEAVLEVANSRPPLTLRVNRRRATPAEYLATLTAQGLQGTAIGDRAVTLSAPLPAERIPGFASGVVSVQDAAAQLAAPLLDLADGQRVLDACAAPGGKTTHILESAEVALTALDADERRLARLEANLARLGLVATVVRGDAGDPGPWWNGVPYDRILADVPCSASGVARRHPDIKWLRRPGDIERFACTQSRLLDGLWKLLKRDGKLLYATCSVFHEENHLQVEHFLKRHRDAQHVTPSLSPPAAGPDPRLPAGQLLPGTQHDGFFYALLQKT